MGRRRTEEQKAWRRAYAKARYWRLKAERIALLGGKCVKCGTTEDLHMDHADAKSKSFDVGKCWDYSNATVLEELKKCQLLCKPCHIKKTLADNGQVAAKGTHGTLSSYRYCKCAICRKANADHCRPYKRAWRAKKRAEVISP